MTALCRCLPLVVLASACMPRAAFHVLEPAAITFPDDVRTLAVVDRSAPANAGEHILGAIEGLVSGEGIGADREAASRVVDELIGELAASPRFDVVVPVRAHDYVESGIFDTLLSWEQAERICEDAGAEALVALEAIDSDSSIHVTSETRVVEEEGQERKVLEFIASRDTHVLTAWRVYQPGRRLLLDDVRDFAWTQSWDGTGPSRSAAIGELPNAHDAVMSAAGGVGNLYGQRIAPHYVLVTRAYFAAGDERLKSARDLVHAELWEEAAAVWQDMVAIEEDPRLRGRAAYDLALYHEIHGRLEVARTWAQRATAEGVNRGRGYLSTLNRRIAASHTLDDQMRPVDP